MKSLLVLAGCVLSVLITAPSSGSTSVVLQPVGDKYIYPFIDDVPSQYRRAWAGVFGAYGSIDSIPGWSFDDRDGQFFLDFATEALAAPGQGAKNYRILSLVVTVVVGNEGAFRYDPTFDSLATFTGGADSDAGRPIELYGVGYRAGWTRETFTEDSPFQTLSAGGQNLTRVRNAYALDFAPDGSGRDVSNNVEDVFEANPWAIADSPGFIDFSGNYVSSALEEGSLVPEGRVFRFQVDLSNERTIAYLQDALQAGRLHLMISSLYGTSQESQDIPKFYTKDFKDPAIPYYLGPQLEAEVLLMPSTAVTPTTGGFRIAFDTVAGQTYQIEYRDSFHSGDWHPLDNYRQGTGGTLMHDDLLPDGVSTRFYRVAVSKTFQP